MVKPRRASSAEKKPDEYCPPGGMSTAAGSKSLCTYSKANVRPSVKCSNDAPELSNTDSSELLKTLSEDSSIQPKPVPVQVATRSSGRLAKRPRKDINPPLSPPKKSLLVKETKTSTPEGKTRRHWELWSAEDKDTFFEALSEFGKDFDAIQNVFAQKHKKKGGPESLIKTKDQIRHFYYRNWHKISKYLKDTSDVNKEVLELYGLINYGHLRKRIGSKLNARNGQKLNELIHRGAALVKVKGKNQRLRTPLCRALKKLNNLEDTKEDEKVKEQVPGRFILELYPFNNAAWARVQAVSQNPRLRIKVKPDCRISTIFNFLNRKWKNDRLRMKESLKEQEEESQELRLLPPAHCKLMPFEVKPAPTPARVDVALINYKVNVKRSGCNSSPTQNKRAQKSSTTKTELIDDTTAANDDSSAAMSCVNTDAVDNADTQTDADTSLDDSCADSVDSTSAKLPDMHDVRESKTVGGDVGDQTFAVQTNKINDRVEKLRGGITKDTAEDVTVGQLYLMMGDPQKMVLQYEWTDVVKTPDIVSCNQRLTNMLRRLIHIATTEFIDLNKSRPQSTPLEPSSPPFSAQPCSMCGSRRGSEDTPPGVKSAKLGRSPAGRQLKRNIGAAKTSAKGDSTTPSVATVQVNDEGRLCQTDARLTMGDPNSCTNDGVFKMPTLMPARVQKQTDIFFNRCNKRMSRNVRRPLVVQRTLLPKTQVPTRQIMTLTLLPDVPQLAQKGSFMPVVSQPLAVPISSHPTGFLQPGNTPSIAKILPFHVSTGSGDTISCSDILHRAVSQANIPTVSDDFPSSASVSLGMSMSMTSMSASKSVICGNDSLLSSSSCSDGGRLGGLGQGSTSHHPGQLFNGSTSSLQHAKDNIPMDISPTSDLCETSGRLLDLVHSTDFNVLLDTSDEKSTCREARTSPISDKTILSLEPSPTKTGVPSLGPEEQWLNGEDFSLSSFLCESPLKRARPVGAVSSSVSQLSCCENSRDSVISKLDVDSTLQCMMNESSLDYASKFADLAAQIAAQDSQISHADTHTSSEEKLSLQSTSVASTTDFVEMP